MTQKVKMHKALADEFLKMKAEYHEETLFNTMRSIKFDDDDYLVLREWLNENHVHQLQFARLFGSETPKAIIEISPNSRDEFE